MLISVIVPVYNAEKFLSRCVESILAQTHTELEILLIDDGSRDGSGAICDRFAALDPRVRVVHKTNGGVSAARNDGLEMARGEWIAFCDNDDFMAPGMLGRLLEMCTANDCDIAHCKRVRSSADFLATPPRQPVKVLTNREILEQFYRYSSPYVWDKLYRRRVWREIRFPVGSYTGEDVAVVHHLLWAARRVAVTGEVLYCHFLNPDSVMLSGFDVRWAIGALNDRLELARREGLWRLYADVLVRRVYEEEYLLVMNRKYNRDPASRRDFACLHRRLKREYFDQAVEWRGEGRGGRGVGLKRKLFMALCCYAPVLYNAYNYLKFKYLYGQNILFGEVK